MQDLLRDFVDVLIQSENELREATENQWDEVLTTACRRRSATPRTSGHPA